VASLSKRVTDSGVFVNSHCQCRLWWLIGSSNVDPTVMDRDQDKQEQTRYCLWRVYTVLYKDATNSDTFAPRHCQWRATIRRFQILLVSLLLIII
jgi:hypothetical protein